MEKARIQIIKNSFQVVGKTLCGFNPLASTDLSEQMGFGADLVTGNISAVTAGMSSREGPTIDLGQKNVRQRSQDRFLAPLSAGPRDGPATFPHVGESYY